MVLEYKGLQVLTHGGNTLGFSSELAFLPEIELGIVVLTNQQGSMLTEAVSFRLVELLYGQEAETDEQINFALERTEEALAEMGEITPLDPDEAAPYLGTWTNDALGEITLMLSDDGVVILDAGEFTTAVWSGVNDEGEMFIFAYDPPLAGLGIDMEEDDDGNPVIIIGGGVTEYTFQKAD